MRALKEEVAQEGQGAGGRTQDNLGGRQVSRLQRKVQSWRMPLSQVAALLSPHRPSDALAKTEMILGCHLPDCADLTKHWDL